MSTKNKIIIDHQGLTQDIDKELRSRLPWSETEWPIGDVYGCQVVIKLVRDDGGGDLEPTPKKLIRVIESDPEVFSEKNRQLDRKNK